MKQLLSISFSILIAMTMSGWSYYIHTCAGLIQSISLFPQESCDMEEMESCHLIKKNTDSCCQVPMEEIPSGGCAISIEGDCCQDTYIFVQYENPTFISPIKLLPDYFKVVCPSIQLENQFHTSHRTVSLPENSRPPPDQVPLYIQFHRLVFYA